MVGNMYCCSVHMAKSLKSSITPMMRQYLEVRRGLPANTLLFFRLGDFYEMFGDDAREGAQLLGITLTHRNGEPMAGIPYHAADNYIGKLLAQGKKVAVCDQVGQPRPGKLVERALTRILTAGTTLEDHQIDSHRSHYLLALDFYKKDLHAAWLDLTTGDFQIASGTNPEDLLSVFTALDPREVLVPELGRSKWSQDDALRTWLEQFEVFCAERPVNELPDYHFDTPDGARTVMDALGVLNLDGFGIDKEHPALGPAGALVYYATESLRRKPENLSKIHEYRSGRSLLLDPCTLRNLEVLRSAAHTRGGSLLAAMDGTVTASGARMLEQFMAAPTLDLNELKRRHSCVGEFLEAPAFATELHKYLKCIRDLPRILGRLQNRIRNPRELGGVCDTLRQLPGIFQVLRQFDGPALMELSGSLKDFPELRALLEKALNDELPAQLSDGGYIRAGYDAELDRIQRLASDHKTWVSDLERTEKKRTGIKNMRIKYNNAFGYFIEVTKSNLHLVPDNYIRKQTMTNAERYYTPELKDKEREIRHSDEQALQREEKLFNGLVEKILDRNVELLLTARALAEIDVFLGWAKLAREWDYCRPTLDDSDIIDIEQGRHPVVEQFMRSERLGLAGARTFVPNDAMLSSDTEQILIITGPNMAGKSTYIRQVAIIVLMAQVGSWVPAKSCRLGLVDRIFSRVGAADELSRGNSTFMTEMNETANIINNTTEKSLIILDEIGRGTSTYDGISIAWAVVEHLHGEGERGPRTLFATHYHELTQIARQLKRVRNYCVAVKEWNDEIIFVRQVVKGTSDRSHGIQVARLAGLPNSIIERAKSILEKLEADDSSHNLLRKRLHKIKNAEEKGEELDQLEMF